MHTIETSMKSNCQAPIEDDFGDKFQLICQKKSFGNEGSSFHDA